MSNLPYIHTIYPLLNIAIVGEGEAVPITNWIDCEGEELENYKGAVTCVAGPDSKNEWLVIELGGFSQIVLQ